MNCEWLVSVVWLFGCLFFVSNDRNINLPFVWMYIWLPLLFWLVFFLSFYAYAYLSMNVVWYADSCAVKALLTTSRIVMGLSFWLIEMIVIELLMQEMSCIGCWMLFVWLNQFECIKLYSVIIIMYWTAFHNHAWLNYRNALNFYISFYILCKYKCFLSITSSKWLKR